ncbi:MAG: hypothetical protein IJ371_03130, partial [Clostridia bacterium]|nr:hypothetical protein [Clostridia bacterium]
MNVSLSNMLATSAWTAFLSVLAIIGIIVAGGFIVALLGRMVLSLLNTKPEEVRNVDEFGYSNDLQGGYLTQSQEAEQQNVNIQPQQVKSVDDYAYGVDVDNVMAKVEEDALNKELGKIEEDDDFFKDFVGDDDVRFGDDDFMGMIDEISQDVLDEEEQAVAKLEQEESEANKSVLDKYSIESYFDEEDDEINDIDVVDETEGESVDEITTVVDEQTLNDINALKQQVKEILESMEENKNQNETFNQQLINILNELKEANKKEVRTTADAEREINELKQQLEDSRIEMEQQLQARIADKDAEMQQALQQQLEASNAEIESLKAQLSQLLSKMEEDDDTDAEEVEPAPVELDEISVLRQELKGMIDSLREENDAKNNEFNNRVLEILNEMKSSNLEQEEQATIESHEDAIAQVEDWQEELELAEQEMQDNFREEMLHKDDEEKAELRAQMESYNQEIAELKEQLAFLKEQFDVESENAKTENQALLDQLEEERKQRIRLEQEKLEIENYNQEQLESLRKENEQLIDKIQTQGTRYETLTQEEMDDLYSEATTIDYSAISKMNEEQIAQKVKDELEDSKQEIDDLKKQVNRLTNYIKEREDSLAEQINVHEVRSADFDIEQIKEITAQEVEDKVKSKIIEALAEIEVLKDELAQTKQEIENQYKDQLANKDAGMEYDRVNKLQESA